MIDSILRILSCTFAGIIAYAVGALAGALFLGVPACMAVEAIAGTQTVLALSDGIFGCAAIIAGAVAAVAAVVTTLED